MNSTQLVVLTLSVLVATTGVGVVTGETTQENVTEVSSCRIIDEPGTYVLTQDLEPTEHLTASDGDPYVGNRDVALAGCLVVAPTETIFDPIVIDGNGHTINGENADQSLHQNGAYPAGVSSFYPNLLVRDVEVTGWQVGINSETLADIENVTVTDNQQAIRLRLMGGSVVNSTISKNTIGIGVAGEEEAPYISEARFANNRITKNKQTGISGTTFTVEIMDNTISENGNHGINYQAGGDLQIRRNTISRNGGDGIVLRESGTVVENVIEENRGAAVSVKERFGIEIHRNHFENNGEGINASIITPPEPVDDDEIPPPEYHPVVNATENYWGDAEGPASPDDPDAPLEDPETGALACGEVDTVSEGSTPGVSNVRFDPWLTEPPLNVGVSEE